MKITPLMSLLVVGLLIVAGGVFIKIKIPTSHDNLFVVGTAAGYAPFVSVNPQGEYEGFDIDIAHALAKKMGKTLVLKDLGSMAPLFMSLEQGTIDAIMWGLSITQARLQKVDMVRYQGEKTMAYPLIFWKEIPVGVMGIHDMHGKTVCVEPSSSQDVVLSKYNFIEKKPTEKVDDSLLNIQYGKVDAALVEPAIAKKFKTKYPEIKILELPLEPEDQEHGVGVVVKKENNVLANELQKYINELEKEGLIKQLEEKWGIS